MSRSIKFRFWSPNEELFKAVDGKMVGKVGNFISPSRIEFNENGEPFDLHGGAIVYQQFTGLLDKNGREIYEGDRVKTIYPEYLDGEVVFCGKTAAWRILSKGVMLPLITLRTEEDKSRFLLLVDEVVGNIFE